jgi:hypothetical protein
MIISAQSSELRHIDMPLRPERVWHAMHDHRA